MTRRTAISSTPVVALSNLRDMVSSEPINPIDFAIVCGILKRETPENERTAVIVEVQSILSKHANLSEEVRASINQVVSTLDGTRTQKPLSPVAERRVQKRRKLKESRALGEVSHEPLGFDVLYNLFQLDRPLTRVDIGNQALELTRAGFDQLGCLSFIHTSGELMTIEAESLDPDDVFILYPSDVAEGEE